MGIVTTGVHCCVCTRIVDGCTRREGLAKALYFSSVDWLVVSRSVVLYMGMPGVAIFRELKWVWVSSLLPFYDGIGDVMLTVWCINTPPIKYKVHTTCSLNCVKTGSPR